MADSVMRFSAYAVMQAPYLGATSKISPGMREGATFRIVRAPPGAAE